MIHLILDTNIWLYIANNFIGDFKGKGHLELFKQLHTFKERKCITIYVSDIIIKEWTRNLPTSKAYIEKLKKKLESKSELIALENLIGHTEALKVVKKEFADKLDLLIKENEEHVSNVQQFLNSCVRIQVHDTHKLKVIDLAINK